MTLRQTETDFVTVSTGSDIFSGTEFLPLSTELETLPVSAVCSCIDVPDFNAVELEFLGGNL